MNIVAPEQAAEGILRLPPGTPPEHRLRDRAATLRRRKILISGKRHSVIPMLTEMGGVDR